MLLDNLRLLCRRNDKYEKVFARFLLLQELTERDRNTVLELLCQFLMEPICSKDISECFPRYLSILLSQVIQVERTQLRSMPRSNKLHRLNCVVLGTLISLNSDVLGFALHYFEVNPAPFNSISDNIDATPKRHREEKGVPFVLREVSTLEIVTASHNILQVAPEHFKHKWNWSEFYEFLNDKDDNVKWIALKCVGIVLKMSESSRLACARSLIKDPDSFLVHGQTESSSHTILATGNETEEVNEMAKVSESLVSIAGVLLPVFDPSQRPQALNLIPVPSMESNLRSLALAVASRRCICLQGTVGCGKTALIEYLANITGHGRSNFAKVQLGEQTDSKMLLGTYRCTDIPGEFVWQPGVLTQAILDGKWLLLEDIDSAALDVASVLSNLMETGTLSVPGYRDTIYAKSGFQLFLTQRLMSTSVGLYRQSTGAANLLEKHWFRVHMEPLSRQELVNVVSALFPSLTTVATRMVDVFMLFSAGNHGDETAESESLATKTGRLTSTRDLIKWCTRAVVDFEVSSPDSALKIFQDAIDIFCCSVPNHTRRLVLASAIGHTLGIVKTKAEYFCNTYKPTINLFSDIFVAGRAKIGRKKLKCALSEHSKGKFSFTRPSAILLERVTSCVAQREPVLLVGETGTGKTSSVQYLARSTGHKLVVINMNQQSESADLLGGYKPVDLKFLMTPTREEFEMLFRSYFALEPNRKFLEYVATCYKQNRWKTLVGLMCHSATAAVKRLKTRIEEKEAGNSWTIKTNRGNSVKRKLNEEPIDAQGRLNILANWERLMTKLTKLKAQLKTHCSLAFAFIEGSLVKALQEGQWVLLDEINLASSETLECLSGLLEGSTGSLSLLERGDGQSIKRHHDFAIFACMNPATDVGKKELPVGLRNRFTEFYVDELTEKTDLHLLVSSYLADINLPSYKQEAIVKMYLNIRKEAVASLYDGTGHKPHYSLRTLCRALSVAASNPCGNVLRSLYEAFCLSFLTQLDANSYPIVHNMITQGIIEAKIMKAVLCSPIPKPRCTPEEDYVNFEGYWVIRGELEPEVPKNYILTNSVRRNLRDLVRVVSIGKMPVLLQGDTSVGKTSLITYLAKASGHTCVRINNHEHTDLQEYVGSYAADEAGKLVFKEGVLVEAMRKGHWIILDELNLAPSDVLEALNRVLDDNRELFIPETQRIVKAHANFMLFATQNPPGLYGGRKVLSRAFRNRFVELHFDEIPALELQLILHERCNMPESYCKQIINVMTDLQMRRKSTAAFQGKHGFITLRDLFRWGERYRLAPDVGQRLYDWSQHLADEGYLVLAAKVRKPEEAREIRLVIKKHLKRDVDPATLFTLNDGTSTVTRPILQDIVDKGISGFEHIVWTYHMRRLAVLVRKSCLFKEPILLVGETGGGKTTVCQLIAATSAQKLYAVNCHMHTESSDFLGNLRPVRDRRSDEDSQKLFEWIDGPLITAMRNGDLFLADEISLADDSVLERLNSLLEPERSLFLAEKSVDSPDSLKSDCLITANENFHFIGTMNPGGDYGKKELSPALRNRFTEIWCEGCDERCDLQAIIEHNLDARITVDIANKIAASMLNFVDWLKVSEVGKRFTVSIRDILTWVNFINAVCTDDRNRVSRLSIADAYLHGACLTYIDSLGSGLTGMESPEKLDAFRDSALRFLKTQAIDSLTGQTTVETWMEVVETTDDSRSSVFGIAPFFVTKGANPAKDEDQAFAFTAPTTKSNTLKLLRALQVKKPVLLEGSPGVGKTSLVAALARSSGQTMLRINLSDQTDVSDLFGADLPLEGGGSGQFAWKDGPFLRALRTGDWILLDELNLASQSVLEGLNACLDHRGEIYIPELGRTFSVKPGTKLFACQNPLRQGGARRGLPKSFLNRFTQVYVDALTDDDSKLIATKQFPQIPVHLLNAIVEFNSKLSAEVGVFWAFSGSPWEMNLRDITRWCEATVAAAQRKADETFYNPGNAVELIYTDRMRTENDRRKVHEIYGEFFNIEKYPLPSRQPIPYVTVEKLYLGDVSLPRGHCSDSNDHNLLLLRNQTAVLRSLARCVQMNWMPILVGGSGCGKSSVVRVLAQLTGQQLKSVIVNSAMDTTEILGGFEQTDYNRHLEQLLDEVEALLIDDPIRRTNVSSLERVAVYHSWLERVRKLADDSNKSIATAAETDIFLRRTEELSKLVASMKFWKKEKDPRYSQLHAIQERSKVLENNVRRDECTNAGGKFEWVDSTLVRCLREGHWLLLDQVNLCSPAVLDRLNGLLEPGGVLTIGERGIGDDGNIITVKPHKNFRLFLTMDPRYGEISRAMRNRGVEIYMPEGGDNSENDSLDLKSMLFNLGLVQSNHRKALLEIHTKMSQDSQDDFSLEKLSLARHNLLHSAFLITQQIMRGFSARQAFATSCVDVYLKSRYAQQPSTKERLRALIDDSIERHCATAASTESHFDLSSVTWSLRYLQDNSMLTIVRQQGFLLDAAIRIYQSFVKNSLGNSGANVAVPTSEHLNEFLALSRRNEERALDANIQEIMPYLLLSFYQVSSTSDVQLRNRWLSSKIPPSESSLRQLGERSESLALEITRTSCEFPSKALPWDSAYLPNLVENENSPGRANRLALILYLISMGISYENVEILENTNFDKNEKMISVLRYSSAVYHGKLTSHLKNEPLITNFVMLISQLNDCINSIFRENSFPMSSEEYVELRRNLNFVRRFRDLGQLTLIDKSEKSKNIYDNLDEIKLTLRVHYKWLIKFVNKLLAIRERVAFSDACTAKIEGLLAMIRNIDKSVKSVHDPFRKIAKRLSKHLAVPPPISSEMFLVVCTLVKELSSQLAAPWEMALTESTSMRELKILFLHSNEVLKVRGQLLEYWKDIYGAREFDETAVNILRNAQDICDNCKLPLRTPVEISEGLARVPQTYREREIIDISTNVQLWPVYEYMFFVLSNTLHGRICEESAATESIAARALVKLAEIPSIPVNFIALLNSILLQANGSNERKRLIPQLFGMLVHFAQRSCAFNDSKSILHWQGISETDVEKSVANAKNSESKDSPHGGPVLINLISELILNKSRTINENTILKSAKLGTYHSRIKQLEILNGILWRNSVVLNSLDYDGERNDFYSLKYYVKVFLIAEEKMEKDCATSLLMGTEIEKLSDSERKIEFESKFRREYAEPLNDLKRRAAALLFETSETHDNDAVERANSWILLGYLQVFLFGNLGYIDPVHKIGLKLRYIEEDMDDCKKTIYVAVLNSRILGDRYPGDNTHPRILETDESLERLTVESTKLKTFKAIRPSSTEFIALAKETWNFRKTLGSRHEIIDKIMNKLSLAINELKGNTEDNGKSIVAANDAIQQAEIWQESAQRFSGSLERKYLPGYPDIVLPLIAAVSQLRHGARALSNETRRLVYLRKFRVNGIQIQAMLRNLIRFPTIGPQQEDLLGLVEVCISQQTREFINKIITSVDDDDVDDDDAAAAAAAAAAFVSVAEQFRMVKTGLYELYNHITLNRELDIALWHELNTILQRIVLIWQQQRNENEKRAAEKDSLYRNKLRIYGDGPSEDEEIAEELRNLFPTSRDTDFMEIEETNVPSLESVEARIAVMNNESRGRYFNALITDDDVNQVHEMHSRVVRLFVDAPWLEKRPLDTDKRDYVEPLIQRYKTFGLLVEKLLPALDNRLSSELYTSLNFLTAVTLRTSEGAKKKEEEEEEEAVASDNQRKPYDFYKSSNVKEAKQCLSLLESTVDKVNEFLNEWPEHPTLKSIRAIVQRIYGFSITSPVSRFLTGLELLLAKIKEWEENAHSGVSLSEYSHALTRQIIAWRKLELACWKDCLNIAEERLKSRVSEWWFFLYALIESYVTESTFEVRVPENDESVRAPKIDQPVTAKRLTELLEGFVNGSSLVEYQPRLELLLTFHSHAYHLTESRERDELLAILWNVYNYYKQFNPEVEKRIKGLKAPIEKKLRDFVKIARWNDINYWSVKETVEKTHRTLQKFIREYETGLKVPAVVCLLVKPSSHYSAEPSDRAKVRDCSVDPRDFIFTGKMAAIGGNIEEFFQGIELVSRAENLLSKAKRLCEETILGSSYPGLRLGLEDLIKELLARSTRLNSANVDRTLPKLKQKSHAKSILQQKRMALADYFKTLSRIGVSYRSGTLAWKNRQSEVIDLTIPPLDLYAALQRFSNDKADKRMLAQWDGCDTYYYKSLIKLTALNGPLSDTRSDLGPRNTERCSGYSTHLMLLANRQKRLLADSFDSYFSLRRQVENLINIENRTVNIPSYRELRCCAKSLKKLLISLEAGLEQLELYLQVCPADPGLDTTSPEILTLETSSLAIVNATREDPIWESANSLLRGCSKTLVTVTKEFETLFSKDLGILTPVHYKFLNDTGKTLEIVKTDINEFRKIFADKNEISHPILESVNFLESRIDDWIDNFLLPATRVSENVLENSASRSSLESMENYTSNVEFLIKKILLAIQHKYKECCSDEKSAEAIDEEEDELQSANSFREKLVESLENDVKGLRLEEVRRQLAMVLKMSANEENPSVASICRFLLGRCRPLLCQYLLFAQFYLNEQAAALRVTCKLLYIQLNIFLDLASNGFCMPKDLDLEEGEAEHQTQEGKTENGMGLGDGEGERDVSDRIESEDQLEDARPADPEKEQQRRDKDCKEEDNGIDMSEDFDSKLQDAEKNDDDEEEEEDDDERKSDNEDNENFDKQMGDTEKGADVLDEEIWGDDEEESENENTEEERDEDNQGKGEEIGEKTMTAKDDSEKRDVNEREDEHVDDNDRAEKRKMEITEMKEPETNDDQIDPYHGNHETSPEPEPLDLPDDINLDDEDANENNSQGEQKNPFDIDEMKECVPSPEEQGAEKEGEEDEEKKKEHPVEDSSDEEDDAATENSQVKGTNEVEHRPEPEIHSVEKSQDSEKKDEEEEEKYEQDENADRGAEEKARASVDEGSKEIDATDQRGVSEEGSRDKVADQSNVDEQPESTAEKSGDESNNKGIGQAQSEQQKSGHSGSSVESTAPVENRNKKQKQIEKRKTPGESDDNRSLVDKNQSKKKKLKIIHSREGITKDNDAEGTVEEEEKEEKEENGDGDVDTCRHVKNSEKFDDHAIDAATKEQVKHQATDIEDDEEKKEEGESMELDMQRKEEEELEDEENNQVKENPVTPAAAKESEKAKNDAKGTEDGRIDKIVQVDGDITETMRVVRGVESAFYTNIIDTAESPSSAIQMERKRMQVERMLSQWTYVPSTEEALTAWNCLNAVTEAPARDLSEKLRLVLEPTQATRLKGDYRTGRRINMRKIIPYIASQFRKDKIWLRRTKPSKRDYQIVLALDDSSSMADNHSKELAFESLSLISKAMGYLEVGQLSVMSFGETVSLLHPLGEPFTENSGSRLIQEMRFEQKKTKVGQLVDFTVDMFDSHKSSKDSAKLLVVLSDGRGVFSEGLDQVNRAVRRARLADIFLVFIVIDNPLNKDSILDIRMPVFQAGKLLGIKSYMDTFPFPFYMILRDINSLPDVLSDALRQWFEVVGKIDA